MQIVAKAVFLFPVSTGINRVAYLVRLYVATVPRKYGD